MLIIYVWLGYNSGNTGYTGHSLETWSGSVHKKNIKVFLDWTKLAGEVKEVEQFWNPELKNKQELLYIACFPEEEWDNVYVVRRW